MHRSHSPKIPPLKNRLSLIRKYTGFSKTLSSLLNNLSSTGRAKKQLVSILADVFVCVISLWAAYSLRLGEPFNDFQASWMYFIGLPLLTIPFFSGLGIYRWVVRSSNKRLIAQICKAGIFSSFVLLTLMFLSPTGGPRSIFAIYAFIFISSTTVVRLLWQSLARDLSGGTRAEPVAIYGAGRRGREFESLMSLTKELNPVFFLDDNPTLNNTTVSGLPVYNIHSNDMPTLFAKNEISKVILTSNNIKREQIRSLLTTFQAQKVKFQSVPSVSEIVAGRANAGETREISLNDLLGRNEVAPDSKLLSMSVTGKSVLVTGGGGSIGSEICRQVMLLEPKNLIVLDQSEVNLYKITEELQYNLLGSSRSKAGFFPILGSICDVSKVGSLLQKYEIDTVYHAAAYKHVPIIETAAEEGFKVNVLGTKSLLEQSLKYNVERFVLISTDKAVRPTNVMGATKRLAELVLQANAADQANTKICMVRFGNVLGSSGSVVPKFRKQIENGGPITVTHKNITRYFMSIPEASQLVLQASALASGGEVFVLDMGRPVKIYDLARDMIALSGFSLKDDANPGGDIEIVFQGLRPGEKMFEEMFVGSDARATDVEKIFVAREVYLSKKSLYSKLDELEKILVAGNYDDLHQLIHRAIDVKTQSTPERDRLKSAVENVLEAV